MPKRKCALKTAMVKQTGTKNWQRILACLQNDPITIYLYNLKPEMMSSEIPTQQPPNEGENQKKNILQTVKDYISKAKVTSVAIILLLVVFAIEVVMSWTFSIEPGFGIMKISPQVLQILGGNIPTLVRDGQIYRLLTACLLHAGILHWLLNTLSLVAFCGAVERIFSFPVYLFVYLVGGIQGNMLFVFKNLLMKTRSAISVGASTSICAIMGLYVANVIVAYFKGEDTTELKKRVIMMLVTVLVISLLPDVDLFGHLGSLISGVFAGMMVLAPNAGKLGRVKKIGIIGFIVYSAALCSLWLL